MHRGGFKKLAGIIALAVFFCSFFPCIRTAASEETKIIRIGIDKDGEAAGDTGKQTRGYMEAYLKRLSYYANVQQEKQISFQLINVSSPEELEQLAREGEIDLYICPDAGELYAGEEWFTEDFMKNSSFMEKPVIEKRYMLCTLGEERKLYFEDFSDLGNARIGVGGEWEKRLLETYAGEMGFACQAVCYEDRSKLEQDVESGVLDAAVVDSGDSMMRRIVGYLGKTRMLIGGYGEKGKELVRLLDAFQQKLYNYEPYFDIRLAEEYLTGRDEMYEAYTKAEQYYISNMVPLRVAVCGNDDPNVSWDKKTGEYRGIYIDLLERMHRQSGIEFTFVPAQSWDECLLFVQEGKADAVFGIYGLNYLADKWDLTFTDPLMTRYVAVVRKEGNGVQSEDTQTVGLLMDRSEEWVAYIRESFPQWEERFYTSEKKCMEAVSGGLVDFTLLDGNSIQADRIYRDYRDLNTVSTLTRQVDIVLGLPKGKPTVLMSVLNKSVKSLSVSETVSSQMSHMMGYQQSFKEFLREYAAYFALIVLCAAAVMIAVLTDAGRRKRYAEQKAAFFNNMSHEIRTPLNGIIGMTAIAQMNREDNRRVEDCLNKIAYSGNHLMTIVNDVLDLSRLENGKMQIAGEPLDLRELLRSMHELYGLQAAQAGIDYDTVVYGVTDERLLGDSTRLSQVLMNLLSNALKFTPAGKKVRLEVFEEDSEPDRAQFLFRVCDEGPGIPKENLGKIFNAYEQQGAKTAGKYGGSGLGLPISRQLVELMGGKLKVDSEPGKGSNFHFSLFLRKDREGKTDFSACGRTPFEGWKALVLEEKEDVFGQVEQMLCSLGITAVDSPEAFAEEMDREEGNCVCLADCDGKTAVKKAKQLASRGKEKAVFVLFGSGKEQEMEDGFRYAQKPLTLSRLSEVLQDNGEKKRDAGNGPAVPDMRGFRVLVAEDNEINLEIICELLKETGCETEVAHNGKEAVDCFARSAPGSLDLILMDIQMPVMDGCEAVKRIRDMDREDAESVCIAAMTADAFTGDREKTKKAGMNVHLAKPVRPELLYDVLAERKREKNAQSI